MHSYWGMDEYSYEMEALSRGRFGRNMRHEHSKQARHEIKRARKLQARADRLGERIHQRLGKMTIAEMRLPRLERLAAALGLCEFEKNVVVSMIGQAIAPRSIGLMGGGGGGGGGGAPSKTMQVEVLLRAFSHSLQHQIEHRKYFYKSAVLVREGILVLHGDELGADLTQTLAEIDRRMLDFVVGLDTEFSELMDGSHLYTPQVGSRASAPHGTPSPHLTSPHLTSPRLTSPHLASPHLTSPHQPSPMVARARWPSTRSSSRRARRLLCSTP